MESIDFFCLVVGKFSYGGSIFSGNGTALCTLSFSILDCHYWSCRLTHRAASEATASILCALASKTTTEKARGPQYPIFLILLHSIQLMKD